MKAIKLLGYSAATFALLCLTGYDCPNCDFKAQTTALLISLSVALLCGLIVAKNGQE